MIETSSQMCAHNRKSPPWTTVEISTVRREYAIGGVRQAAKALPHRSESAIRAQVARYAMDPPPERPKRKFPGKIESSPEVDALIVAAHRENMPGWKGRLAQSLGRSPTWVKTRAEKIGLQSTFKREPVWSFGELDIVKESASLQLEAIVDRLRRAGYRRSAGAIKRQISLNGFDRDNPDVWSGADLARLMGVSGSMVYKWMDVYGLKNTVGKGETKPHRNVTRADLRRWVRTNNDLVDLRKVDQVWFKDVMWGGA